MVSDWGAVRDSVAAVEAGLDVRMPGRPPDTRVAAGLTDGSLSEVVVEKVASRLHLLAERIELPDLQSPSWTRRSTEVDYPFGHGLSYTTFDYSDLDVIVRELQDPVAFTVALTIANSGTEKERRSYRSTSGTTAGRCRCRRASFAASRRSGFKQEPRNVSPCTSAVMIYSTCIPEPDGSSPAER